MRKSVEPELKVGSEMRQLFSYSRARHCCLLLRATSRLRRRGHSHVPSVGYGDSAGKGIVLKSAAARVVACYDLDYRNRAEPPILRKPLITSNANFVSSSLVQSPPRQTYRRHC